MAVTITRIRQESDIDFPIYIAIPHQRRAEQWFLTAETQPDPEKDDRYILGDHDLHGILCIENFKELQETASSYAGHQSVAVRAIAEEALGYDVEFRDNEGHIAYGTYESETVYSVDHAPTQDDFDHIAAALDNGGGRCAVGEQKLKIEIPDDLGFADLNLARAATGDISFDWLPIEKLCNHNGLDIAVFKERHEDNVAGLIVAWYAAHLEQGGKRDAIADDLIAETQLEDKHGGGISHSPGRG